MQPGKIDSEKKQNKENVVWREEEILDREKENLWMREGNFSLPFINAFSYSSPLISIPYNWITLTPLATYIPSNEQPP